MGAVIIETPYAKRLYGIRAERSGKNAWDVGKPLMDAVWADVRAQERPTTGINYWYYHGLGSLFVGVELLDVHPAGAELAFLDIQIPRHAFLKHIGPYSDMHRAYDEIAVLIRARGRRRTGQSLEIYGHDRGPRAIPEVEILVGVDDEVVT